ncbi:MAG: hypothetical protein HZB62_00910 [Nitrospirae bacterium]|nr:hypothetical protein [Nitrospirota bacterium]
MYPAAEPLSTDRQTIICIEPLLSQEIVIRMTDLSKGRFILPDNCNYGIDIMPKVSYSESTEIEAQGRNKRTQPDRSFRIIESKGLVHGSRADGEDLSSARFFLYVPVPGRSFLSDTAGLILLSQNIERNLSR